MSHKWLVSFLTKIYFSGTNAKVCEVTLNKRFLYKLSKSYLLADGETIIWQIK